MKRLASGDWEKFVYTWAIDPYTKPIFGTAQLPRGAVEVLTSPGDVMKPIEELKEGDTVIDDMGRHLKIISIS